MKTKITLIITFLFFNFKLFSQEEKILANKDGVEITYQLILENEGKRKNKYILIVNATNNKKTDLFYNVNLVKDKNGKWNLPYIPEQKGFTKVKIRNSSGLFGNGQSLFGELTNLLTTDNSILYKLKSQEVYSKETTFKIKKGKKPLITNTFTKRLKPLEDFNLKISKEMLDGDYTSSCGNIKVNINALNDAEKGDILIQTTNGKQFTWLRKTETSFVRENNSEYSLTFNKSSGSYTYSTSDGISCEWNK